MKILITTNLYPPFYIGGYELYCQDVAERLRSRGHEVLILTSTYGLEKEHPNDPEYVQRTFRLVDPFERSRTFGYSKEERQTILAEDSEVLQDAIDQITPDLIYVWNMSNVHRGLMRVIEDAPIPKVYHLEDRWIPSFYEHRLSYFLGFKKQYLGYVLEHVLDMQMLFHTAKKMFNRLWRLFKNDRNEDEVQIVSLSLQHSIFLTEVLKQEHLALGYDLSNAVVIHNGIDLKKFRLDGDKEFPEGQAKLLYVGRVAEKKGVHTAVKAISILKNEGETPLLSIIGDAEDEEYVSVLKKMAHDLGVGEQVSFQSGVAREKMSTIYREHDILIFPSIWEEPFGLVLIEAMASKLPIVSTRTGGTQDFLEDEKNALIFKPANARQLADHLKRLLSLEKDYSELSKKAFQFAKENFDIEKKVDEVEKHLERVIKEVV